MILQRLASIRKIEGYSELERSSGGAKREKQRKMRKMQKALFFNGIFGKIRSIFLRK